MSLDATPRVLGPYVLLAPLAHGGMGSVYLAALADPSRSRDLCLVKTLKAGVGTASDYRPRFLDESRVAVLLRHPNLCRVDGGGEDGGEFYLAMELIEGITFKRLLAMLQHKEKQLSPTQAIALAIGMLRGLHAAHQASDADGRHLGVVHRDVSPHNAMVDVSGAVKVIDFGLATSVLKETFTESAVVLGKSAYMAPEQSRGEDVTPAVDQYAAGIILYELLTDDRYYGDMPSRQIWSVVGVGTHRPRAWGEVPAPFIAVLQRALAPRAEDRFPSCAAFADALAALDPLAVAPETTGTLGKIVRRLKPDELDAIAAARLALIAYDAAPLPQAPKHPTGPDATKRPLHDDEPATAETSATVVARPRAVVAPSRAPLVAAGLGLVALGGAAAMFMVAREPAAAPPPVVAIVTPGPEAVPVPAPVPAPQPSPPSPPSPPHAAPTLSFETRRDRARVRAKTVAKGCEEAKRCVEVSVSPAFAKATLGNIATIETALKTCKGLCQ